ncbi:MAG: methyltransferase domain-containing protein [Gammaproteobacteria bacterium]|nr:methyltransferase domain-containing protein [Gammaproteobacteria bacterium]
MSTSKTLIFTTCFNERENIGLMIDQIIASVPDADVLIVDDNSPDGTWDIVEEKRQLHSNIYSIRRPRKLGIGSAHKYAIFYAIREGYDTLVTMDADFSHDPREIPNMLKLHDRNVFVTGSRYCEGGTSDYTGYRDAVSRIGNIVARNVLGIKLKELTTYFRVFDVESLKKLPLRHIDSSGYSYGVELVYYLRKCGVQLREYPIHFSDRTRGASKIPRMQIFASAFDLLLLGVGRLGIFRDMKPDVFVTDACPNCGDSVLAMKHYGSRSERDSQVDIDEEQLRCTAVGSADYPPVYTCLCCSLEQVPRSLFSAELEDNYENVVDTTYLENIPAREKTFARCFDQIAPFVPVQPATLLEVGAYCGLFLKEVERRGWQGEGVEPSRWAAQYALNQSGVKVFQGFLAQNRDSLKSSYDVVVSWDVLEHVRDPKAFIESCAQYLQPGGTLCVSTMDINTWAPRLLKTRWPWLMNMHLYYFDRDTVADLLGRAGFTLEHTDSYVHYARVRYVYSRGLHILPGWLQRPLDALTRFIPEKLMVPVSLGDIKLFIARKKPVDSGADHPAGRG